MEIKTKFNLGDRFFREQKENCYVNHRCKRCKGTGYVTLIDKTEMECSSCKGEGKYEVTKFKKVKCVYKITIIYIYLHGEIVYVIDRDMKKDKSRYGEQGEKELEEKIKTKYWQQLKD